MFKQMCWLPTRGSNGQQILHLRTEPLKPWRPYTAFPEYAIPDYPMPIGSKGWATYQKLRNAGWSLEQSTKLQQSDAWQPRKSA